MNNNLEERLLSKLQKIQDYILDNTNFDKSDEILSKTAGYDILKIINESEE